MRSPAELPRALPRAKRPYRLFATLVTILSLCMSLAISMPAHAQVICASAFSYVSGNELFKRTDCGANVQSVLAGIDGEATLSPDEQFVATWQNTYQGQANVKPVDGSAAINLGVGNSLTWSPDSSWLALSNNNDPGVATLEVVSRDGKSRQVILTQSNGADFGAAWSPDGNKIATIHRDNESNLYSLYVQDRSGANRRELFVAPNDVQLVDRPAWTPDGNFLVFTQAPPSGGTTLHVVGFSGGATAKLSTVPGHAWSPTIARNWSLGYINDVGGPHMVVQAINNVAGALQLPYINSFSRPEFRAEGAVTAPPPNWPPTGVGVPPPPVNQGAQVVSVASTITATTPRWRLDLSIGLRNVACPAKVKLTLGTWTKTIAACGENGTAPATLKYHWKVFDKSHSLAPKSAVPITAFVVGSKAPQFGNGATLSIPDAPVWGGLGDSYSSGHHQDRDNITCVPEPPPVLGPCRPDSLFENDVPFSWVARAVNKLNKNVPAEWRYRALIVAQSGATTRDMFEQGQIDKVVNAVNARGQSWSVISFTGGANDLDFVGVLRSFYSAHPTGFLKPWGVKNWASCPDTQTLHNRLVKARSDIRIRLQQIIDQGRAASSSVRFIDMMYPYVLKAGNTCQADRQIPNPNDLSKSLTWHGAGSVIDQLNGIHLELNGPDIYRVDLRAKFGANPLPKTQLTRYYGYPHPTSHGQEQMATAAMSALP
jgi:hypothetical protein